MWFNSIAMGLRRGFSRSAAPQRAVKMQLERLDERVVPAVVDPSMVNLPIAAGLTPHAWNPDSTGLYYTSTDLAAEWLKNYNIMLAGNGKTLTAVERMEGNAEAVLRTP